MTFPSINPSTENAGGSNKVATHGILSFSQDYKPEHLHTWFLILVEAAGEETICTNKMVVLDSTNLIVVPAQTDKDREQMTLRDLLGRQEWDTVIEYVKTPAGALEAQQTMSFDGIDAWAPEHSMGGNGKHDDERIGFAIHHPLLYRLRAYERDEIPREIAPISVIQALLNAFPEGSKCRDMPLRNLPLHRAAGNPWDADSVDRCRVLLQAFPEGVQEPNNNGELPLHLACQSLEHCPILEMVAILLDAFPQGAAIKDYHGNLPIHSLCNSLFLLSEQSAQDRSADCIAVFKRIVEAYPESLETAAQGGELPLHMLCQHHMSSVIPELINLLVATRPDSVLKGDPRGNLPVHLLTKNLFFHWQDYKEMLSNHGRAPNIREAAVAENKTIMQYGEAALLTLTKQYSDTLRTRSSLGFLPLNLLSCLNDPSAHIWKVLTERCPGVLLECDGSGNTALSSRVTTLAKYEKQWDDDAIVDLRSALQDPRDCLHFILKETVIDLMSIGSQYRFHLKSSIVDNLRPWMAHLFAYCGRLFHPEDLKRVYGIVFDSVPYPRGMVNISNDGALFNGSLLIHLVCGAPWPQTNTSYSFPSQCIKDEEDVEYVAMEEEEDGNQFGVAEFPFENDEVEQIIREEEEEEVDEMEMEDVNDGTMEAEEELEQNEDDEEEVNMLENDIVLTNGANGVASDDYWSSSRQTPATTLLEAYMKNEPRFLSHQTVRQINNAGELPLHCLLKTFQRPEDIYIKDLPYLVSVYPDSVAIADGPTGLMPFMLAGIGSQANLTIVYILLKQFVSLRDLVSHFSLEILQFTKHLEQPLVALKQLQNDDDGDVYVDDDDDL